MSVITEYRKLQKRVHELRKSEPNTAAEKQARYDEILDTLNEMVALWWQMSDADQDALFAGEPDEP